MTDTETTETDAPDTQVIELEAPIVNVPDGLPEGGRWAVNLHMRFDAEDPAEAVKKFLDTTLDYGLRSLVYSVRDRHSEDDELFFVEDGVTYTEEQFNAKLEAEADANAEEAEGDREN